ncbi:MAG TPA: pilus assembly protein PilM [bacterium]|nr:pilus assembly protein PilM [bacterium]
MFFKRQDYPIGLDISDFSLKFVQLYKKANKIGIQSFGKLMLEKGIIENNHIKDMDTFIVRLKELIDNPKFGRVTSKRVVVCLPEPKTFIKLIKIPRDKKLDEEHIEREIKKYIPISPDETYYDWQTISKNEEEKTVLVGVSPKVFVDQYIEAIEGAKLSLIATEIESVSIVRSLLKEESANNIGENSKNYGIIDIGANRSSMFVYAKNTILFNISIPISGEKITDKIAKELNILRKKAELAKIICGIDKSRCEGIVALKISESIKNMMLRINDVLDFHGENFSEYGKIDNLIICGGGANINSLDKELEKSTNIKSYIGNPFNNIDIISAVALKKMFDEYKLTKGQASNDKTFTILQNDSLAYCTAIGLALREIFKEGSK